MAQQKKIFPLDATSEEKFVPKIVLVTLERLDTLVSSKIARAEAVPNQLS